MFYYSLNISCDFITRTCNVNSHASYAEAYLATKRIYWRRLITRPRVWSLFHKCPYIIPFVCFAFSQNKLSSSAHTHSERATQSYIGCQQLFLDSNQPVLYGSINGIMQFKIWRTEITKNIQ